MTTARASEPPPSRLRHHRVAWGAVACALATSPSSWFEAVQAAAESLEATAMEANTLATASTAPAATEGFVIAPIKEADPAAAPAAGANTEASATAQAVKPTAPVAAATTTTTPKAAAATVPTTPTPAPTATTTTSPVTPQQVDQKKKSHFAFNPHAATFTTSPLKVSAEPFVPGGAVAAAAQPARTPTAAAAAAAQPAAVVVCTTAEAQCRSSKGSGSRGSRDGAGCGSGASRGSDSAGSAGSADGAVVHGDADVGDVAESAPVPLGHHRNRSTSRSRSQLCGALAVAGAALLELLL